MIGMKVTASLGLLSALTAANLVWSFSHAYITFPGSLSHWHSLPSLGYFSVLLATRQPDSILLVSQWWVCVGGTHTFICSLGAMLL